MKGRFIELRARDGATFEGYLATPSAGNGPGLLVLHEVFGVNAALRAMCDEFAALGYVTLAPDMFWRQQRRVEFGYSEAEFKAALHILEKLDWALAVEDMRAAVAALASMKETRDGGAAGEAGVAAVGYRIGGRMSLYAAANGLVDASVCYYPVRLENDLHLADTIVAPVLMHFGVTDPMVPPTVLDKVKSAFSGKANVDIHVYAGVGHGFANRFRTTFDPAASELAHARTIDLLRATIGPRKT